MTQHELAARFRQLHDRGAARALVLPNAWDAMTARVVEDAGAEAVATTSAGIAWALHRGMDAPDAVRRGMAAAADKLGRLLPGVVDAGRVEALTESVEITRIG